MAYDYTDWPVLADVKALCLGAHVDTTSSDFTMDDVTIQGVIDARAALIERLTQRQFVKGTAGEVRYFDGSGTGILYVDEYVDVSAIDIFYLPTATTVSVLNYVEVDQQPWCKEKIQILQGQPNANYGFFQYFPVGRANIKITGTWGYGDTIPTDVWTAVLQASAADVLMTNTLEAQGQIASWSDGDADTKYSGRTIGESAGWLGKGSMWEEAIKAHKRPLRSHLRKDKKRLY